MPDETTGTQDAAERIVRPAAAVASSLKPAYDDSWAVIIGVNDYRHFNKLNFAVSDAAGVATLLVDELGFPREKVLVLLDPPPEGELPFDLVGAEASKSAIEELLYTRLPNLTDQDDRVVVFFAGHGESRKLPGNREKGYLVPATGMPGQWHTYVEMDDVIEAGDLLQAKHVFYLMDACFSGLATARSGATPTRYQSDMLTNRARQVLTAGTARQAVADRGPGGHSLFTSFVLNGLRGDAHQSGSAAVTGSDLMVYVKNQVGQAGDSRQTPDFGMLPGHESGGDFIFLLPPEEDDYERALRALDEAQIDVFRELTARLAQRRPGSAEALYLQYRLHLIDSDIDAAMQCINDLQEGDHSRSAIPLSHNDLWELTVVLPFWKPVLEVPEGSPPLTISLWAGAAMDGLESLIAMPDNIREGDAVTLYEAPQGGVGEWRIENRSGQPLFIYYIQFDAAGRLDVGPLLTEEDTIYSGLPQGKEERSDPFGIKPAPGLVETRIFALPDHMRLLMAPPRPNSRAVMEFSSSARKRLVQFQRTTIWYRTVSLPDAGA